MRREDESLRFENDVLGNLPCRGQVLLEQRWRHGERFTRIVETRLIGGIDRELACRSYVEPGEVADGVIELGVTPSPGQNGAGVAGIPLRLTGAQFPNPFDGGFSFLGLRLEFGLLGRHFARVQPFENKFPLLVMLNDSRNSEITAEIERSCLLLRTVAGNAIPFHEWLQLYGESCLERICLFATWFFLR